MRDPVVRLILFLSLSSLKYSHVTCRSACKTTLTFLFAAILSCSAAASLLIAASMWSAAVSHVQATNRTKTGIVADFGQSVWLTWAAFAFSLLSVLPYVVRYCSGSPSSLHTATDGCIALGLTVVISLSRVVFRRVVRH